MVTLPQIKSCFILVVGALCFVSAFGNASVKPGILARVTKQTFDYVTNLGINQAVKEVRQVSIPDKSGSVRFVKYNIYNMKIKNFDIKAHSVAFVPTEGMNYKFADISLAITGRVHLKAMHFISLHSSFEVDASRISIGMNLKFGFDNATGRPTAIAGGCTSNVPTPSVTFHGGSSWVLRFFSPRLGRMIRDAVQKQICSSRTMNAINSKITNALKKIPTNQNFLNDFSLDFRMLQSPTINSSFLDSEHKGEVFWQNNHKECPLPVRPMEPLPVYTTKAMTSVQISAYLLNSFAYVAYKNHYIHYIFNSKNIPKAGLLNTTCQNMCIGKLIPALAKAYPNQEVSVLIEGTEMPQPNIDKGYLLLDSTITVTIYLSTDSPNKPLIIVPVKIHTVSTGDIINEVVHFNISVLKLKLGLVKKGLPIKIDIVQLQHMINFGINAFVMPQINQKGSKGFPLPQFIKHVKMVNTQFHFGLNSAIFMTDFKFMSDFDDDKEDGSWFSWLIHSFGYPGYRILASMGKISSSDLSIGA